MAILSTTSMVKALESISSRLTPTERATLAPMSTAMHSGVVTQLSGEQVEALDAMYADHFGSTANA